MLDTHGRRFIQPVVHKAGELCVRLKISPNAVTLASFVVGVSAGLAAYLGLPWVAVVLLWVSGFLDVLDGTVARLSGKTSPLGTLLDIVLDRIVELGIVWALVFANPTYGVHGMVLVSSFLLSMTVFLTVGAAADRRGEKSFYYQAGIAERTEGFLFLSAMLLVPAQYLGQVMLVFAAVVVFTAGQRFFEAVQLFGGRSDGV